MKENDENQCGSCVSVRQKLFATIKPFFQYILSHSLFFYRNITHLRLCYLSVLLF